MDVVKRSDNKGLFFCCFALCGQVVMNPVVLICISPSREAVPLAVARVVVLDKAHDDAQAVTVSRS